MNSKPKLYIPGQDAAIDKLVSTYERVDHLPLAARDEAEDERSPDDPFGVQSGGGSNGRERAKRMTDKLLKLGALLLAENGVLDPADQLFAYELFSLNVLNSVDCPLTPTQIDAIRREAFDYYREATKHKG